MAYVAPSTRSAGEFIDENDWNQDIVDNQNAAFPLGVAAWTTWSPTHTNITVGNGTVSAKYQRIGRTVHFRWKFTLGSTSAIGTSPQFTLPVTAHADFAINMPIGSATLLDSGVQAYVGWPIMISTTTVVVTGIATDGTNAVNRTVTATVPFTWGTGDVLMVVGTFESAS